MNRRGFLALAAAAVAGLAIDPEHLAWTPGERTHILPPPRGWRQDGAIHTPFLKGDVIEIAGIYAVNPQTGKPTGHLRQFVIVEDHSTHLYPRVTIPPAMWRPLGARR